MKRLVKEYEFTPEQLNTVRELANRLYLTETTASLLYARGMDTEEKMRAFLSPGKKHFLSPFLMKGMKEAVELITQAKEEGWNVAVFGDYDADGVGACAILSRALRAFGIEPYLYVPERAEGYGLNEKAIDRIFDEFLPDLFITVDCGISNADVVEYIKEQGAYVIVTDHHELPEVLPDCIVVNPKLKDDYPFDNLCGAGVAFKLACALLGEKAYAYLDFAALSTVADSVPLLGENRDIVAEGLKLIQKSPRPAFEALLQKSADITAQTLAFTLAPRINAAGRMGDAKAALRLFTTEIVEEVAPLAEKLNLYNAERQRCCDELYARVSAAARAEGAYGNVIMLAGEDWNAGFVGIVAARIAEEFSRPALLFVRHGDTLRGSARSIDAVNIFEALKACSEYIEEFGGHSQAAGINVTAENFDKLKAALDAYIGTHYAREDFEPTLLYTAAGDDPERLAHELERLEPFGMGNKRPLFAMEAEKVDACPVKAGSPHISFPLGGMSFMDFGGVKDLKLLRSDVKKTIVFEYNLSNFRGREYLKGFVRAVLADGMSGNAVELDAFEEQLRTLGFPADGVKMTTEEMNKFLTERLKSCAYGLAAVCSSRETLESFPALKGLPVDVFRLSSPNVGNTVLYAPEDGCDLSSYRDVFFLDMPAGDPCVTGKAKRYYNVGICGYERLKNRDVKREDLLEIFAAVKRGGLRGETLAEAVSACRGLGFGEDQLLFSLAVFEELGLIVLENGTIRTVRGARKDLSDSSVYTAAVRMKEE